MRIIKKYKLYTKVRKILEYPTRILKFKRPKWFFLKKQIQKARRMRFFNLQNSIRIKLNVGRWSNLKWSHSNRVLDKRALLVYFNNNKTLFRLLKLKNLKSRLDKLQRNVRYQYFLSFFLFRQKIVSSTFESHLFLRTKKVLVNDKILSKSVFLKRGDFIYINDFNYFYEKTVKKFSSVKYLDTFIESDYYSQTFSIIKDSSCLSYNDISLSLSNNLSF